MRRVILATLLVLLLPAAALALDCTPSATWTCASNGFFNTWSGQPGEVICGVDYTGWTLKVVNVNVTTGGWVDFAATVATGPGASVATAVILMDNCAAGTCVASEQSTGVTQLDVCLEPGTHTFVVAAHTTAPNAIGNMGLMCLTCAQAETMGLTGCPACGGTVSTQEESWGSLKARFK